ncbi:MAG TPA: PA2778 family cysteine peptidase [Burkholderiales bacterium]|nr:PA2778 family cysteine peptidase [Burkholderiales bacterium]
MVRLERRFPITGRTGLARNARVVAGVFVSAGTLALAGCSSLWPQSARLAEGLPADLPERVELAAVPFFPQKDYQCGPAALATALVASGVKVTPDELVPQVYLPARKGSLQVEMMAAARRHGLVSYELAPRFEDLLRELAAGTPVIVLQNLALGEGWHYAVAVGYDYPGGTLVLRSGETEREVMNFVAHETFWKRSGYWAMVAVPPERIPATAEEGRWLAAIVALERAGGVQPARRAYAAFLKRWPANVGASVGLANTLHAAGDLAGAERVLREAERRDPASAIVLNNLAQTLSDQGRHEEALPFIERAVAAGGPHAAAIAETRRTILERITKK